MSVSLSDLNPSRKQFKKEIFKLLGALIIFSLFSIYITFPLLFKLGMYTTGAGDELLIAWIHSWVIHVLFTNPLSLFNANIYYPYYNSLAFSDLFITGSLLTAPFVYLFSQPIVANNVTFISSLIFLGFSLFLLSYYLTTNYFSSLLSGMLIIFSPATLSNAVQIQMLEIYWVPLSILFFLIFLKTNKTKFFMLFLMCFLLQFYNSFLPAYFILFSVIIIFLLKWLEEKEKIIIYLHRKNLLLLLISFIFIIPLVVPYFQVSQEFHYTRDLRDSIHFALQPEDLLFPGVNTRLGTYLIRYIQTNQHSQNNEFKAGYLGLVFSFLVLLTLGVCFKDRKKLTFNEKGFLTIAFTGLVLSFGPFLHLNRQTIHHPFPIPLPYMLFYYVMPGFQGFRNSQRWEMLFIIGIAVVISLVFVRILKRTSIKKQSIIYCLLFIGIIAEFLPFNYIIVTQKENFPKIYSWMATSPPETPFIILPIYNWNMQPYVGQELYREYYSTIEFRPMVNGYSGFSPPPWQEFIGYMHKKFPDNKSVLKLHALGVRYIIIDKNSYDQEHKVDNHVPAGNNIISELRTRNNLTFIKNEGNYFIFAIK